ncbi:MAG TPA: DivIVA domain-containing protein [Actinomycetota bacterium]|nr:DivIVA domain-containing protein [Actinomycetota bacterium]
MGTWEPDLSPPASTTRNRQPSFATVFRGYDPNQVAEYLSRVADHVEALESNVHQLESELKEARRQGIGAQDTGGGRDPYDGISPRVADLVRTFDQDVERLRAEAEAEVQRLLAEARTESERLTADARTDAERTRLNAQDEAAQTRAEAERTLREARIESDQALSTLVARRDALVDELRAMRDRMLDTAKDLETTIEGSIGDQVVLLQETRGGDGADATSVNSSNGPDPNA